MAVAAIAIAAAFANVALLGSTGEDRLGRLRAVDSSLTTGTGATPAPAVTTTVPRPPVTTAPGARTDDSGRGPGGDRDSDDD